MSRPRPKVLTEITDKKSYLTQQVLEATGIYAVFYQGSPVNLKTANRLVQYPGPKYRKASFSNPGHAINLAKKLNTQFKTDEFTVVLLKQGETIFPNVKK